MKTAVYGLVLAAGKGTRMKSAKVKVLHEVFSAPMVHHVLDALQPLGLDECLVIVGHQREAVEAALQDHAPTFMVQEEQRGTGHAVLCAEAHLKGKPGTVLILCGDTPLIEPATLRHMLASHMESGSALTVMATILRDPANYGRIITGASGNILRIVEEKDASPAQRRIREVNAGIYCVASDFLFPALREVGTENEQGEVYLTDIIALADKAGHRVNRFVCPEPQEVLGVNSRVELAQAHAALQMRRNMALMASGVTLIHPETICIEKSVTIGRDTVIQPNVTLSGETGIGEGCRIGAFATLRNCRLADGVEVGPFSYLRDCDFPAGAKMLHHTVHSLP